MHGVLAQESGPIRAVFGSFENSFLWVTMGVSLIALLFAYYLVREVLAAPEGTEKMKEIAKAIQEGAKAYLSRQFRTLAVFLGILTVILFFILPAPKDAVHSGVLDQVRALDRVHPGRGLQRDDRLRGDVAGRPRRTSAPRTPRASRACGARCGSRSAPAAWPGCSRWASGCSARR